MEQATTSPDSPVRGLIGREALRQLAREGILPGVVRIRSRTYVRLSGLRAWLDAGAPIVHPTTDGNAQ